MPNKPMVALSFRTAQPFCRLVSPAHLGIYVLLFKGAGKRLRRDAKGSGQRFFRYLL